MGKCPFASSDVRVTRRPPQARNTSSRVWMVSMGGRIICRDLTRTEAEWIKTAIVVLVESDKFTRGFSASGIVWLKKNARALLAASGEGGIPADSGGEK